MDSEYDFETDLDQESRFFDSETREPGISFTQHIMHSYLHIFEDAASRQKSAKAYSGTGMSDSFTFLRGRR